MTVLSSSQILDAVRRGLDLVSTRFAGESKEILVVGAGHVRYQIRPADGPRDNAEAFKAELTQIVRQHCPAAIAEEMSLEALKGRETVGQEVAQAYGLDHQLCDPTSSESKALGIDRDDSPVNWQKREAEWVRRLAQVPATRILFICGANHVDSLARLCRSLGWTAQVICADFKADIPLEGRVF